MPSAGTSPIDRLWAAVGLLSTSDESTTLNPVRMDSPHQVSVSEDVDAPHQALQVPELLSLIFSFLERPALTRAARVCSFWSPIALELVWKCIPRLTVLLSTGYNLIPAYRGPYRIMKFSRPPEPGGLDVIRRYSQFVQKVDFCAGEFAPEVVNHLYDRFKVTPTSANESSQYLLPQIRELLCMIRYKDEESLAKIIALSSPRLRVIRLDMSTPNQASATQVLNALSSNGFYGLSYLAVGGEIITNPSVIAALMDLIQRQSNLQDLRWTDSSLTTEFLGAAQSQTRLKSLTFHADPHEGVDILSLIGSSESFVGLRKLCIGVPKDLRHVEITIAALSHLKACRSIRSLRITALAWESLTPQSISEIGRWWPSLECFGIDYEVYSRGRKAVPLWMLPSIAQVWCNTLQRFYAHFYLEEDDWTLPHLGPMHPKLLHLRSICLDLPGVPDHRITEVAEFLAELTTPPFEVNIDSSSLNLSCLNRQQSQEINDLIRSAHASP